jgi:hypothetical protein
MFMHIHILRQTCGARGAVKHYQDSLPMTLDIKIILILLLLVRTVTIDTAAGCCRRFDMRRRILSVLLYPRILSRTHFSHLGRWAHVFVERIKYIS